MDWRLRPLALVVKLWAQFHHINNAKDSTISSYSLVLMVIHFLQCATDPPVLPCLHAMYPQKFLVSFQLLSKFIYFNPGTAHMYFYEILKLYAYVNISITFFISASIYLLDTSEFYARRTASIMNIGSDPNFWSNRYLSNGNQL